MDLVTDLRNDFDEYFKEIVLSHTPEQIIGLRESVSYHFGWNKIVSLPGKRLRPLFLLLTYCSFGGAPQKAYNPAVALEVLHNYTLVHDDIEDGGETRHGQPALWVETGMPLAINVGDYLASLSHTIMSEISEVDFPPLVRKRAIDTFQQASLEVIQGQQLDITYENYPEISVDQYLEMIRLKTSRLFASAMTISARLQNLDLKLEAKLEETKRRSLAEMADESNKEQKETASEVRKFAQDNPDLTAAIVRSMIMDDENKNNNQEDDDL